MTRGKDEGKALGPMFPRLHVNDADKGGPRAPPRNKMALYEQLSIPSQRSNPSFTPFNPNTSNSSVTTGFSTQGNGHDRKMQSPFHPPPLAPSNLAQRLQSRQSDPVSLDPQLTKPQPRKGEDEDDFMVPVFERPWIRERDKKFHSSDVSRLTLLNPSCSYNSRNHKSGSNLDLKRSTSDRGFRQGFIIKGGEACVSGVCAVQSAPNLSSGGKIDGKASSNGLNPVGVSESSTSKSNSNEPDNDSKCCGNKIYKSLQNGNMNKADDTSETSMVDSLCALEISPDDVVRVLGQKLFWKARNSIVNQQKVFAVQVFELHRLIKVQRLFAGSPHLLLDDLVHLGQPSLDGALEKKLLALPSKCTVKSTQPTVNCKFDSEMRHHNLEYSAENAVEMAAPSSTKTSILPLNYDPFLGFPPPAPIPNAQMAPWCVPLLAGHQWLIPVMSPSEGLIYKPYPGPGLAGSNFGGYGPMGASSLAGSLSNPACDAPSSNYQGIELLPGAPLGSHGSQTKFLVSKDSELQGSTTSSPCERVDGGAATVNTAEGRDALPFFPIVPQEEAPQHCDSNQPMQVIKVVPHNQRSATESAARILQSIQQERKRFDLM